MSVEKFGRSAPSHPCHSRLMLLVYSPTALQAAPVRGALLEAGRGPPRWALGRPE